MLFISLGKIFSDTEVRARAQKPGEASEVDRKIKLMRILISNCYIYNIQWTRGGGLQGFMRNAKPLCYTEVRKVSGVPTSKDRWKT